MSGTSGRIVIVGAGFAGADLARRLCRRLPPGWEVVVFSRENHVVFTPLLAEVVGATIDPRHVVWPVREMARGAACRTTAVRSLDLAGGAIVVDDPDAGEDRIPYDHLVLACGMSPRLDLVPGMGDHGWALKTLGDAIALRNHVLQQLEVAEACEHPEDRARHLSFVVVGGGFTGVEIAGSIRDLLVDASRYYQRFGPDDLAVTVIHGAPHLLQPMPEPLARYAEERLARSGIIVKTEARVESVDQQGVCLKGGERIDARTTIGAIGNAMRPLVRDSGLPTERGRIPTEGTMRVPDHPNVWALGDCAAVPNAHDDSISPTLGQFALRQSKQLAKNLRAVIDGGQPHPFRYHPQGMFAALGHRKAVGSPFGMRVTGLPAYLMWKAIYWHKLPSRARKLQVAFDWSWDLVFRRDIVTLSTERSRDLED